MYRNPDSEPNIRRIDSHRTHGFQFHVVRGDIRITRLYSDTSHGDKEIAREAARAFRDRMIPKLPEKLSIGPRLGTSRSNTGVMGITIVDQQNSDGTHRVYVQANARPPGSKIVAKRVRLSDDTELTIAIHKLVEWRRKVYSGKQF